MKLKVKVEVKHGIVHEARETIREVKRIRGDEVKNDKVLGAMEQIRDVKIVNSQRVRNSIDEITER